jgi:CheY-like chemotaxis protein
MVELPILPRTAQVTAGANTPLRPVPAKKSVLIIDDDPEIVLLVKTIAELEGYDARTASNGMEALSLLLSFTPDLIFLDLMMPGMDGWTFSRELRKHPQTRSIPIVVLSGVHDIQRKAAALPIDGVISKPFEYEDLRTWFRRPA